MKFYTNIQLIGNQFLIRGYENGQHVTHREEWKPTLFVPSRKKTKYKTLEGESVEPIQPGFVRDCREFYKKYDEVENFKIFNLLIGHHSFETYYMRFSQIYNMNVIPNTGPITGRVVITKDIDYLV